jgi:hypothetical protein
VAVTIGHFNISRRALTPIVSCAGFYCKKFGDIKDRVIISIVLTAANIKITGKGKVVPIHIMKACMGIGGIDPLIFILGARLCEWQTSYPSHFTTRERAPGHVSEPPVPIE